MRPVLPKDHWERTFLGDQTLATSGQADHDDADARIFDLDSSSISRSVIGRHVGTGFEFGASSTCTRAIEETEQAQGHERRREPSKKMETY